MKIMQMIPKQKIFLPLLYASVQNYASALDPDTEMASVTSYAQPWVLFLALSVAIVLMLLTAQVKVMCRKQQTGEENEEKDSCCGSSFMRLLGCCGAGTPLGSIYINTNTHDVV